MPDDLTPQEREEMERAQLEACGRLADGTIPGADPFEKGYFAGRNSLLPPEGPDDNHTHYDAFGIPHDWQPRTAAQRQAGKELSLERRLERITAQREDWIRRGQRAESERDQALQRAEQYAEALRRITYLTGPAHTPDPLKVMHQMDDIARAALSAGKQDGGS